MWVILTGALKAIVNKSFLKSLNTTFYEKYKKLSKKLLFFSHLIKKFLQIYHKSMFLGYPLIFPIKYFRC